MTKPTGEARPTPREAALEAALEDAIRRFAHIAAALSQHTGAKQRRELAIYARNCCQSAQAALQTKGEEEFARRPADGAREALRDARDFLNAYVAAFSSGEALPDYEKACALADRLHALTAPAPEGLGEAHADEVSVNEALQEAARRTLDVEGASCLLGLERLAFWLSEGMVGRSDLANAIKTGIGQAALSTHGDGT